MIINAEPDLETRCQKAYACLVVANRIAELSIAGTLLDWEPTRDEPASVMFRQAYAAGGLDAVDDLLKGVNACLESVDAIHGFFPGAATEGRADRDPEFLVVTSCVLRTNKHVTHHLISTTGPVDLYFDDSEDPEVASLGGLHLA